MIRRDIEEVILKSAETIPVICITGPRQSGKTTLYTTVSNSLGVDVKTIRAWLSILETSYIVFMQPPWFRNVNKRLIKSPRLFFLRYRPGL